MEIAIYTKYKAQVLKSLAKADEKFQKAGKKLSYVIKDSNPLDDRCEVDVQPDQYAKYVQQYIAQFVAEGKPQLTKAYVKDLVKEQTQKIIKEILKNKVGKR